MILGSALRGAARFGRDGASHRSRAARVFRNAGVLLLAAVGVVAAGDPSDSLPAVTTKTEPAAPQYLPSYPPPGGQSADAVLPDPGQVLKPRPPLAGPSPNSVVLPPIQSLPNESKGSSSSARPSGKPSADDRSRSPSLLEPPPPLGDSQSIPTNRKDPGREKASETTAEYTLDVVIGQPRLLAFPDVPQRVVLTVDENDPVASLREVPRKNREWYLVGKKPGTAFLDIWLADPTNATSRRVLHYTIHVLGDPENKEQRNTVYQTLEREINRTFPGSVVRLKQAGDSLVVSGYARNVFEATRILLIARENAPGARRGAGDKTNSADASLRRTSPSLQATLDDYQNAGGPHVINLLRIPGEQQIMLRIVVTEVNRAAARSLGVDFGIGEKQATIFRDRPATADGSSTLVDNGWIAQAIKTLEDLHYAHPLAEPTLTTLNGQTARFQAGGEFPVPVVTPSPSGAVQGISFRPYGVQLSVQPVVADTDRIRLTVSADVSATDPAAGTMVGNTAIPGMKVRNFQSTVELREGETLAVAGLIRSPGGDAPPPGVAPQAGPGPADQELVVLVSPLLLRAPGPNTRTVSRQAEPVVNPLNPRDIEMYLRSGGSHVPRGDAMYLFGPQGYAEDVRQGSAPRR